MKRRKELDSDLRGKSIFYRIGFLVVNSPSFQWFIIVSSIIMAAAYNYMASFTKDNSILFIAMNTGIFCSSAIAMFFLTIVRRRVSNHRISQAPATRLVSILKVILPRRAFERIFSQIIADYREEFFEALAAGHRRRARWLGVCLWFVLSWTAVFWIFTSFVKRAATLWKMI